jgi:CRP-like cAMP-binding protein
VLQRVPMLRMLPVPTIEHLACRIRHKHVQPGAVVFREGTLGARFYVVVDGEVDIVRQGRRLRRLGPGDGFGEIALLRESRRTATVRAADGVPVELYALTRSDFVTAVVGVDSASSVASSTIDTWLADSRATSRPADGG